MSHSIDSTAALVSLFADPTRVRLMHLLTKFELSVAEMTRVTGLTQSRVSSHLGRLREAGLVYDRRCAGSTLVRVIDPLPAPAAALWAAVCQSLADGLLDRDLDGAVATLKARNEQWPDRVAGEMEHHYSPGRTWEATARGFVGLMALGDVVDLGSGDGALTEMIIPQARTVTCVDRSKRVIAAARHRLRDHGNVRFVVADIEELPLSDGTFDQAMLFNALTYAHRPERVLAEAYRVLRPGGSLSIVTLDDHDHNDVAIAYQHVNRGFTATKLHSLLSQAGFVVDVCDLACRERRKPYFQVVRAFVRRPAIK